MTHDADDRPPPDPRPTADRLGEGWRWLSPANRVETVTRVRWSEHSSYVTIWTDRVRGDPGWWVHGATHVDAAPPDYPSAGTPKVLRMIDTGRMRNSGSRLWVVLDYEQARWPWSSSWTDMGIHAEHLGQGKGWTVQYRPTAESPIVVEDIPDKAKAKARVAALMRELAKAMDLPIGSDMGRGDLPASPPRRTR